PRRVGTRARTGGGPCPAGGGGRHPGGRSVGGPRHPWAPGGRNPERVPGRHRGSRGMKPRALVTGASRGIGAAIARSLAAAGHPVIVNYRSNREAAEAVCAAITTAGGEATAMGFDVADGAAVEQALGTLLADPRPLGVLVNNAGVAHDGPFPAMERPAWETVTRTTLDGFYNVTRPLVMP